MKDAFTNHVNYRVGFHEKIQFWFDLGLGIKLLVPGSQPILLCKGSEGQGKQAHGEKQWCVSMGPHLYKKSKKVKGKITLFFPSFGHYQLSLPNGGRGRGYQDKVWVSLQDGFFFLLFFGAFKRPSCGEPIA